MDCRHPRLDNFLQPYQGFLGPHDQVQVHQYRFLFQRQCGTDDSHGRDYFTSPSPNDIESLDVSTAEDRTVYYFPAG